MSYFKPLNSIENGLYFIRFSVTNNGANIYPAPDQNSLLSIVPSGGYLYIYYDSRTFDNPLSVFVSSNIAIPYKTGELNYGTPIWYFDSNLSYLPDLDIYMIGKKASGPVYAVSNKGWNFINEDAYEKSNTIYSKMLIGINNMNTTFNLSHSGNIGFIPNKLNYLTFDPPILQTKNLNLINIGNNTDIFFTIPTPILQLERGTNNIIGDTGQLLDICISNKTLNGSLTLNTSNMLILQPSGLTISTSNILMTNQSNIVLKSIGDSVSLCSYKSKWIIMDKNINEIIPSYNIIDTTTYNPSIYLNGNVSILQLSNSNEDIDLPSSEGYDGKYIEMFVQSKTESSNINFILSNITCSQTSIIFSNIGDHVKLIGYRNKWLLVESNFN